MSIVNSGVALSPVRVGVLGRISTSVRVWFGVLAYLFLTKVALVLFFPGVFVDPGQAALFEWMPLAVFWLVGLAGVLLADRTGFPQPWGDGISKRRRVLLPVVVGLAFAVAYVAFDLATHFTQIVVERHGLTQQYTGFLGMLVAFSAASVLVEIIFRLVIIPLALFLLSSLLLRGRAQAALFWVLAVLTSALEAVLLGPDLTALPQPLMALDAAGLYALNFAQVVFFRRYGYLSAILVRVAYYAVWHALYVH